MSDAETYKISFSSVDNREYSSEYMDGFSEGYSRAWQECWDFMLEKIQLERKEQEEAAKKRAEAETAS